MSSHLQLLLGLVQSSPTLSLVHRALWRVETAIILLTLLIVVLSVARLGLLITQTWHDLLLDTVNSSSLLVVTRFDKHGQVSGWLGGMFSCFNFFNQLYEGPSDSFQGEYLLYCLIRYSLQHLLF